MDNPLEELLRMILEPQNKKSALVDLDCEELRERRAEYDRISRNKKVYVPLAPYGVCEGKQLGYNMDLNTGISRAEIEIPVLGPILIEDKWVFDTFEQAMECFLLTGGDTQE